MRSQHNEEQDHVKMNKKSLNQVQIEAFTSVIMTSFLIGSHSFLWCYQHELYHVKPKYSSFYEGHAIAVILLLIRYSLKTHEKILKGYTHYKKAVF